MDAPAKPVLFPRFYRNFSCIGAACENNCCHNWCISIDRKTWQAYENHDDSQLAKLVQTAITTPEEPTDMDYRRMTMTDKGICPAYRDDGLCDIHDRLGEELLSQACKSYPRRMVHTPSGIEPSLAMSCPEAARLILLDPQAMDMEVGELIATDFAPTRVYEEQNRDFEIFRETALAVLSAEDVFPDELLFRLGVLFNFVATSQQNGESPEPVCASFQVMNESGVFSRMYRNLPEGFVVQAEILKRLLMAPSFWNINSVLAQCHEQFGEALNRHYGVDGHVDLFEFITDGYEKRFKPVALKHRYAFVNFFKHWIYSSDVCYLSGEELTVKFSGFILQYSIIRSCLSALSENGNHEEVLVKVVHALSRGFDHHPPFLEKILAYLRVTGMGHPMQMMGLLKIDTSEVAEE